MKKKIAAILALSMVMTSLSPLAMSASAKDLHFDFDRDVIADTKYDITVDSASVKDGKISLSTTGAKYGEIVKVKATPKDGYRLTPDTLTYTIGSDTVVIIDGEFSMPSNNTLIKATFAKKLIHSLTEKPIKLEVSAQSTSIVTLKASSEKNTNAVFEYAMEHTPKTPEPEVPETPESPFTLTEQDWQTSSTFTGLTTGDEYKFYARYAGDDQYEPSAATSAVTVTPGQGTNTKNLNLWDLQLGQAQGRPLVRVSDDENNFGLDYNFKSKVYDYNVYLRSTDTKSVTLYMKTFDTEETVTVMAEGRTTIASDNRGQGEEESTLAPVVINVVNGGLYQIRLQDDNDGSTTYNINVIVSTKETDPQIVGEVKAFAGSKEATLTFIARNVAIETATITINIEKVGGKDILGGFIDEDGKKLTGSDLGYSLVVDTTEKDGTKIYKVDPDTGLYAISPDANKNFFAIHPSLTVGKLISAEGKFIHLVLEPRSLDGKPAIFTEETPLISFKIEQIGAQNLTELSNALKISGDGINNNIFAANYKQLIDITLEDNNIIDEVDADDETLITINPAKPQLLRMILNHDAAADRMEFEVLDNKTKAVIGTGLKAVGSNLRYELFRGSFDIAVRAKGYLSLNYTGIDYSNGTPTKNGIKIEPIDMLAGDLNNDGVIDLLDRAILIANYGKATNAQGSTTDNGIFGDYNNDARINGLDLGVLLKNLHKKYTKEETTYPVTAKV